MSVLSQIQSIIIDQCISSPGNGKEVIGGLNSIYNCYMYQLMSNVPIQLSRTFDLNILMHYCTQKNDVSLAKELQKHLYRENCKHGVIDQGKYRKISSKIKWTYRQYHVQDNADISHKDVKMYCDTNKFPTLSFCASHPKTHG